MLTPREKISTMAHTVLNTLNAFIAVARRRSYVLAAKDAGVSTSGMSQAVRQLEDGSGSNHRSVTATAR